MLWKFLSVIYAACVVLITVLLALVLLEARKLLQETRTYAASIDARATSLLSTVDAAAEQAREASDSIHMAAAQANLAAAEQRAYWKKTSLETYKTMASLRLTIVRADHSLNDVLAPQLARTLRDTDSTIEKAGNAVSDAQRELTPAIENLARASS